MTQYIYPQNLKAKANLWFWGLRDFVIICVAALISVVIVINAGLLLPAALTLCYAFLSIRIKETTVMENIGFAFRYFLTTQQHYEWR